MNRWAAAAPTAQRWLVSVRSRSEIVDHGVRAGVRYAEVGGSQLSASITYYGFLAAFPLIALVYAVVDVLSALLPELGDQVNETLSDAVPSLVGEGAGQIQFGVGTADGVVVGTIALAVLVYAGLRWVMTMRWTLHAVAGVPMPRGRAALYGFARDLVVLLLLGVAFLSSLAVSALTADASDRIFNALDLDAGVERWMARLLAFVAVFLADALIATIVLLGLSGARPRRRDLLTAALAWAAGFAVLKLAATWIVGFALSNPIYGTFALTIGVLIWINWSSRWLLLCGAWAVTSAFGQRDLAPAAQVPARDATEDEHRERDEHPAGAEEQPTPR
jgi:membrane protein